MNLEAFAQLRDRRLVHRDKKRPEDGLVLYHSISVGPPGMSAAVRLLAQPEWQRP